MMYKALFNDEDGTIMLSEWITDHETKVSIRFPVEVLNSWGARGSAVPFRKGGVVHHFT